MPTHNWPDRASMESGIKHCAEVHLCAGCPYSRYAECTNKLSTDLWRYIRKLEGGRIDGKADGLSKVQTRIYL